jgi:hypothetical protein
MCTGTNIDHTVTKLSFRLLKELRMKPTHHFVTFVTLTVLGVIIVLAENASSQTRLGLHVTQEELNIWKQRASSGPYKSTGDVSPNSPGDWTRIQSNANTFLSNPSAQRWSGQPAGSCWSYLSNPPSLPPGRDAGEKQRDAGFYYLLTGNTSYRDAVLNELLAQAATPGTNWADSTLWNVSTSCAYGDAWSWEITAWLTKLLYGYDYIRNSISAANRATLDTWFTNAANLWNANTHAIITTRFPNRDSDDYTTWGPGYPVCIGPVLTHFGGFTHCDFHEGWSNRSVNHIRFVGLVGIMTNNTALKDRAKRWVKEWVRFTNFADSTNSQFHRSIADGHPGIGWNYVSLTLGGMVALADAFARIGDLELFNYSISLGSPDGSLTPAGGPKSILSVVKKYLDYVDGTVQRYATTDSAQNGDPNYKIDSVDEVLGTAWISDIFAAQGNLFWRDARVKSGYLRQAFGAPAYPSNPSSFGACVYCGDWATLPGVLFMFGQMEGQVNPYGGTRTTTTPPPLSSGVTVDSTYDGYTTTPIDDGVIDAAGGTATTWASAESVTSDHWINIALPSAQQINTATIYWAYTPVQQKYMTSQRVDVQYWNGSSYVTAATITYPGSDIPSSTVTFPAVTTSQVRFYQPANQGNPTYPTVFWITEVDYAYQSPPSAPTNLQVSVTP